MHIVVFVTASGKKEAGNIAGRLIKDKLAACVNIVEQASSLFWWEGKVDRAKEALLIIKTRKALFNRLVKKVKSLHSYDTPEIIALPVIAGDKKYLEWLDESTR